MTLGKKNRPLNVKITLVHNFIRTWLVLNKPISNTTNRSATKVELNVHIFLQSMC
jgi:hypothetical protein